MNNIQLLPFNVYHLTGITLFRHVFEYFTERIPRSHFDHREVSFLWNYKYGGKCSEFHAQFLFFLMSNTIFPWRRCLNFLIYRVRIYRVSALKQLDFSNVFFLFPNTFFFPPFWDSFFFSRWKARACVLVQHKTVKNIMGGSWSNATISINFLLQNSNQVLCLKEVSFQNK